MKQARLKIIDRRGDHPRAHGRPPFECLVAVEREPGVTEYFDLPVASARVVSNPTETARTTIETFRADWEVIGHGG